MARLNGKGSTIVELWHGNKSANRQKRHSK